MNDKKYRYALILISSVILITLVIQVYWNYKNYEEARRQLIADVQISLDQSVDEYYTQRAKNNTLGIFSSGGIDNIDFDSLTARLDATKENNTFYNFSSLRTTDLRTITVIPGGNMDTLNKIEEQYSENRRFQPIFLSNPKPNLFPVIGNDNDLAVSESVRDSIAKVTEEQRFKLRENIKSLTTKIVVSFTDDTIDAELLDSLINTSLERKKINLDYALAVNDSNPDESKYSLNATAQTALNRKGDEIAIYYGNILSQVLKRNLTGILLSILLIAGVIFCLFYLLQVIKNQKELGEMKNDLISNITHEFKTPIATTAAALEGVQNFTTSGDTQKTDRYLTMGQEQLRKLNGMVEKLLETATLDSSDLNLQMGQVDLNEMISNLVTRSSTQTDKEIKLSIVSEETTLMGDNFHLENALNNLIDNAIKYGGDSIHITIGKKSTDFIIKVSDSGKGLSQKDAKMIFDKFYRVGQGNKHNVKGFGIGLFYTRSIIDKHGGSIEVITKPTTTFIITLPDGK